MDPKAKKETLRMLSNGMYVVTSRNGGNYGAATITWLSQASFKPPLIMAAVRTESNLFECMSKSRVAGVNIIGFDQQEIAQKFLSTTQHSPGVINDEPYRDGKTSVPILVNVPAYMECEVREIHEGLGDHAVVVLEVVEAGLREHVRPLTVADSPWEYGG